MGRYETFDHTADVGLMVIADDLGELFATAAEALFDYIVANRTSVRFEVSETIALEGESLEGLLLSWLNELIFLSETQHRVYGQFDVRVDSALFALSATIHGEAFDRSRHEADHEVKAVTHHGAGVRRMGQGWHAEVILDI